jgi:hypothetical protein
MLEGGFWILDFGFWILDYKSGIKGGRRAEKILSISTWYNREKRSLRECQKGKKGTGKIGKYTTFLT